MDNLQATQTLNLAAQTLKNIEELPVNDEIKKDLVNKLLEGLGILRKPKKYTPGSQKRMLEYLQNLGGSATRANIASASGLDPNVVSSLLNKLVKTKKVEKIKIDSNNLINNRSGRGLASEYIYKIVDKDYSKDEIATSKELSEP